MPTGAETPQDPTANDRWGYSGRRLEPSMSGRMIFGANHSKDRRSKPWLIITQSSCSFSGSFRDMNSKPRPANTSEVRGCAHEPLGAVRGPWLGATDGPTELERDHREQPEHPRAQALSLGRRDDGQSLLAGARQCRAAAETLFGRRVDATTIDLCLAVFPWASFRRTRPRSSCTSGRGCRASSV